MSLPKIILFGSIFLFAVIGTVGAVKKFSKKSSSEAIVKAASPLKTSPRMTPILHQPVHQEIQPPAAPVVVRNEMPASQPTLSSASRVATPIAKLNPSVQGDFPNVDRTFQLFTTGPSKLPIVETVTYSSSVPWLKGRPAWIADYASHYETSRHFIARSLNGKPDYLTQKVSTGSRFNVFRSDKKIQFHILIDITRCKMGLYYVDLDTQERLLIKTYDVGLGRVDPQSPSGILTPLGTYSLGSKVAIYKPGMMGLFHGQKAEMVRIFGTRWIPFDQEFENATAPAKGNGIHGSPWREDPKTGELIEDCSGIGAYESDACIRLSMKDMEELFAIVITKPTFVVIVKNFHEAKLPGVEVVSLK